MLGWKNKGKLSVVVPCYNEAQNLPALVQRFKRVLGGLDAELVLVDNGSTDDTAKMIGKLGKGEGHMLVRTVRVERNVGYGHGIKAGLRAARGEFLAWTHADLQADPADVAEAYRRAMLEGNPRTVFVKGNRRQKRPLLDAAVTMIMGIMASACLRQRLFDINAQPKLFHRSFRKHLKRAPDDFSLDLYAYYKARKNGMRIIEIPVGFGRRMHGESKWASSPARRIKTIAKAVAYIVFLGIRDILGDA